MVKTSSSNIPYYDCKHYCVCRLLECTVKDEQNVQFGLTHDISASHAIPLTVCVCVCVFVLKHSDVCLGVYIHISVYAIFITHEPHKGWVIC